MNQQEQSNFVNMIQRSGPGTRSAALVLMDQDGQVQVMHFGSLIDITFMATVTQHFAVGAGQKQYLELPSPVRPV